MGKGRRIWRKKKGEEKGSFRTALKVNGKRKGGIREEEEERRGVKESGVELCSETEPMGKRREGNKKRLSTSCSSEAK